MKPSTEAGDPSASAHAPSQSGKTTALQHMLSHLTLMLSITSISAELELELELELIQTQMAQKPMLRAEVYARAMRAST